MPSSPDIKTVSFFATNNFRSILKKISYFQDMKVFSALEIFHWLKPAGQKSLARSLPTASQFETSWRSKLSLQGHGFSSIIISSYGGDKVERSQFASESEWLRCLTLEHFDIQIALCVWAQSECENYQTVGKYDFQMRRKIKWFFCFLTLLINAESKRHKPLQCVL